MARNTHHRLTQPHMSVLLFSVAILLTIRCTAAQQQQPFFGDPNQNASSTPFIMPNQQATPSVQFSPSMAIVIVVLIAAFFFLGFFSIYIRQCAADRGDYPPPAGSVRGILGMPARSRRQPRGLDPEVIETFPTMAYADVKAHKAGKGALECAVCLSEFEDDEKLRLLPKCSHVFHPDCIGTWLASHDTCPVCRANLEPDPNAPADAVAAILPVPQQPTQESATDTTTAAGAAVVIDIHTEESNENEEERKRREQEAAELERIGSVRRALRSKSGRGPAIPTKFPRSHTTGHSLAVKADEDLDRYTLRLPDHVLREIVAAGHLKRSSSLVGFPGGEGSTRRGYRGEGSSRAGRSIRLGRSGRWATSFLPRNISVRMPKWGSRRESDGSTKGKVSPAGGGAAAAAAEKCEGESCTRGRQV